MITSHDLSTANLALQGALALMVLLAAYLAAFKSKYKAHCTLLRIAVLLQILSIAGLMLPSMLGYIQHVQSPLSFSLEMYLHHTLGLVVVALWVYINLVLSGKIRSLGSLKMNMRLASFTWLLTLALGIHLYVIIMGQP